MKSQGLKRVLGGQGEEMPQISVGGGRSDTQNHGGQGSTTTEARPPVGRRKETGFDCLKMSLGAADSLQGVVVRGRPEKGKAGTGADKAE